MKLNPLTILTAMTLSVLLSACESFGEGAKGLYVPSYSEKKSLLANAKKLSPEELNQLTAGCPKPNGVFLNEAQEKGGLRLESYFRVPGFEIEAEKYPGGRAGDAPIKAVSKPIDILGGMEKGVRQDYNRVPGERFTLELRPREHNKFLIGVKSTSGLSGEAEGYLSLSGEGKRCENSYLKYYRKTLDFGWELYVEAGSGDIVIRYPAGDRYIPNPAGSGFIKGGVLEERFTRFKRIGN